MTLPRMRTASQRPTTSFLRSWHQVPSRENTKIASCGADFSPWVKGQTGESKWTVHHGATHRGTQPREVAARWPGIWAPASVTLRPRGRRGTPTEPGGCPVRTGDPGASSSRPLGRVSDASSKESSGGTSAETGGGDHRGGNARPGGVRRGRRRRDRGRAVRGARSASWARPASRSRRKCPSPRSPSSHSSTSTCPARPPTSAPPGPSTRCPTAAPGSTSSVWRPGRPRSWATRWPTRARGVLDLPMTAERLSLLDSDDFAIPADTTSAGHGEVLVVEAGRLREDLPLGAGISADDLADYVPGGGRGERPALVPLAGEMPVDYPLPLDIPVQVDGELIGGSSTRAPSSRRPSRLRRGATSR